MNIDDMDIDWEYLLERLDHLLELGVEYLSRQMADYHLDPLIFRDYVAFRWRRQGNEGFLAEVAFPDLTDHSDLLGIDLNLERLRANTEQFVRGFPANNVLLWGERGSGKSSAVKGLLGPLAPLGLRLVEVQKEDLFQLPDITGLLRGLPYRFILFCDDLSFAESDPGYRELKALLDGSIEARAENILVYATSNRRHLLPEHLAENTGEREIHPEEAVAEKLSLSDRFGITLGFYPMSQDTYLSIVRHLAARRHLSITSVELDSAALQWVMDRGARSGRVARQFIDDLTGRLALMANMNPHDPDREGD
jgi:predicted AAA+ superfamily ATPase